MELGSEGFHADPADRIIVATAIIGGHQLATADHKITSWAQRSAQRSQLLATFDPTNLLK
ncbi:MAG: hypothetical protein OXI96_10245 [Acidimicrobiaceae bacterium]|nr:hypothetical protein [Acidimicrobiaceae bacterium]